MSASECEKCGAQSDMPFHLPVFSLLNCPGCGAQGTYVAVETQAAREMVRDMAGEIEG